MKKILIIGINGTIGKALKKLMEDEYEIFGTTSKLENATDSMFYIDFSIPETIENFKTEFDFDHIIVTAGKEPQRNLKESDYSHVLSMFNIHVMGPLLFIKKIADKINFGGSVTFISSPAAYQGSYDPSYAAVKGAINALVRTLAKDLAPKIRVNAMSPSLIIDSPVYNRMTDDFKAKHINNSLTKKLTTAQQCAEGILYLIKGEQITGQILHINGGLIYGY